MRASKKIVSIDELLWSSFRLSIPLRALEVAAIVFLTACGGGDPIATTNNGSIRGIVTDNMRWSGAIEGLAVRGLSNVESTQRAKLRGAWRKSFIHKDLRRIV